MSYAFKVKETTYLWSKGCLYIKGSAIPISRFNGYWDYVEECDRAIAEEIAIMHNDNQKEV